MCIRDRTDNDNNEEEIVGMPNPFVEYKTVDEAQKVLPFSAVCLLYTSRCV